MVGWPAASDQGQATCLQQPHHQHHSALEARLAQRKHVKNTQLLSQK